MDGVVLYVLLLVVVGWCSNTVLAQFIDDTPDGSHESTPAPKGVKPVITLDKDDLSYDLQDR